MAYTPFSWEDRVTEHPNRRRLTNPNDQSDTKLYDVSREEGQVIDGHTGTPLNATTLNALETRITNMNNSLFGTVLNNIVIPASGWDSETHLISITVNGVTATSQQIILPLIASNQTFANNQALQQANIMDAGQATDSITLYAENVPTTDLQVRIIVRK